jgi:hypothetical protein
VVTPECANGLDDDGDGLVDHAEDPGCTDATDPDEHEASLVCDDGEDNDDDGYVDHPADPGCGSPTGSREDPACQDGLDNDADTRIDFDGGASLNGGTPIAWPDPQCSSASLSKEKKSACGLGFEVVLLLGPLIALRRRRRPRRF